MFKVVALFSLSCALAVSAAQPPPGNLSKAEDLYKHTSYEASLALLDKSSNDAATNFLLGRDYFMLGEYKNAADALQKATSERPANSDYMDWLGRTYGKRAETANPLLAPSFALKARQAFEQAVQLNPKNSEAMSDLFDFYLNAPGFLGGGYEKASQIADQMAVIDPPEAYHEKAQLAQKRKEFTAAEQQFRQAIAAAPQQVGHMISLAKFLADQGRTRESDEIFLAVERQHPNDPEVWFAHADVLIKQKRNLGEAKSLLEKYIQSPVTADDPPKQEAQELLKQAGGGA
ncbi:MAG TPA: tetratricopeptide repeat protein [Terriglobia bacterium]|nr:tetratricopeptide repeat protein [Terriglobia bacterium]